VHSNLGGPSKRVCFLENPKHEDKNILLREVVKFDSLRILSRLRSSHAKRTRKTLGKPVLIPQLYEALNDSSIKAKSKSGISQSALRDLRDKARELQIVSTKLENLLSFDIEASNIQEILIEIVRQAHELSMTSSLSKALHSSSILNPSLKDHLPEALGKLERYYAAASELVCAARDRQCRAFLAVQIEACQIQVAHQNLVLNAPVPIYEAVDGLFQSSNLSQKARSRLKGQLASSLSQSDITFRRRMADISQQGKIHAEIQLLFFYEIHPRILRPRVICSSKSACYLCNLFIQIHNQFFMHRTHGRLYDKWILPDWLDAIPTDRRQKLGHVVNQLNTIIEDKIRTVFTGTQKPYLHPNKSVLVGPALWPSTSDLPKRSTVSSRSIDTLRQATWENGSNDEQTASATTLENPFRHLSNALTQLAPGIEGRTKDPPCTRQSVPEHGQTRNKPPSLADLASSTTTSSNTIPPAPLPHDQLHSPGPYQQLPRGELLWKQLLDASNPLQISTTSIHTTISPATWPSSSFSSSFISTNNRWVQLKWLHPEEQPNDGSTVVHVKYLEEGVDMVLRDVKTLYLCHAQDVLSIMHCLEGPK